MKLDKVIAKLQEIRDNEGDLECFTNGEHGNSECVRLELNMITDGPAEFVLSNDFKGDNSYILHIGDY